MALRPFQRENRYIVIKRSHLHCADTNISAENEQALLSALIEQFGLTPIEAVVVEADWPEYETVWRMIEARVTGTRPTPSSPLRSALFEILRRHDVSEQCFAECAALTFERPVSSDMVADECSTCVGTGSVQTTSDGPPTFGFTACPDCQTSSDMVEAMAIAENAYSAGNLVTNDGYYEFDLDAAATVIAEAMAAKDAELAELRTALAEADRKNDALSNEWNQAEAQLAELRAEIEALRGALKGSRDFAVSFIAFHNRDRNTERMGETLDGLLRLALSCDSTARAALGGAEG